MSWLGRLFGRRADAPAPADTFTVAIPEDVAAALTADGSDLGDAVVGILRGHLESIAEAVDRGDIERIPFWLARERGADAGIEEALRDRVAQRRAEEGDTRP
ncbi:MAG: hypothetical protein E6J14_01490 [Chloroflexi bacterium]|nr:MAG: hypothetical protein E6J14_01490 [Chloroflexota bacterium]